uniref:Uncharacterized protein n=1 Tax=Knipowitschia caucasica TaxID=637954 RepID=A0AAV2JRD3_KNICA
MCTERVVCVRQPENKMCEDCQWRLCHRAALKAAPRCLLIQVLSCSERLGKMPCVRMRFGPQLGLVALLLLLGCYCVSATVWDVRPLQGREGGRGSKEVTAEEQSGVFKVMKRSMSDTPTDEG